MHRIQGWAIACLILGLLSNDNHVSFADEADDSVQPMASLLAARCLGCHSGDKPKGGLDLSSRQAALAGGDSGEVLLLEAWPDSLIWEYVNSDQMPPKKALSNEEKAIFQDWLAAGAPWPKDPIDVFARSTEARAGKDWWSLQPVTSAPVPEAESNTPWIENPIDAFVWQQLQQHDLMPSPAADKRALIRRLSFDLLGLPPSPDDVEAFVNDDADDAYVRLVNRMLDSPHYGERWARHWLDVVRFGESNGFEYDQPRNNAWPYRNWVIQALNQDLPYDQFVRLQLAGDVLQPDDYSAAAATGYLVAGPHNTTLPANDQMRMVMAQDELEDLVGNVGQTFLGLTVNCARCHDHKFDPISQREYYQLAASLTGVTHGERSFPPEYPAEIQQRKNEVQTRLVHLQQQIDAVHMEIRAAILAERPDAAAVPRSAPVPRLAWDFTNADANSPASVRLHGTATLDANGLTVNGQQSFAASTPLETDLQEKTLEAWVMLSDLDQQGGAVISVQKLDGSVFDAIVFGEQEPRRWMAGSNGFARTKSFGGVEETAATQQWTHVAIVYHADGTITGYRNGQLYGQAYASSGLQTFPAKETQVVFGLRHSPADGNRLLNGRIRSAAVYDRALSSDDILNSFECESHHVVSLAAIQQQLSGSQREQIQQWQDERALLQNELAELDSARQRAVYTCVGKDPQPSRFLPRGNVSAPGETVAPSGLLAIQGIDPKFELPPNATDAERRQALANWVTDANNPLFARVIVNRLWLAHFGQGLVATPSDFGFNGGQPSHPELLDWLASQLQDNGFRLKELHRLMVTSATYRQASTLRADAAQVDADNRWLWRMTPRRLTAEEIRDAALLFGKRLDRRVGEIGYRDVRHFEFKGSNFYESIEEPDQLLRRTVYRFTPRGGRNPFLDTFDCPDPSVTTPLRATTTTPLQALALMNNPLVFQLADAFAERVALEANQTSEQIDRIYHIAYGRGPSNEETESAHAFVEQFGLSAFCRIVFNSNEFLYVR